MFSSLLTFNSDDPSRDDWVDVFPAGLIELNLAYCHVLSDRYVGNGLVLGDSILTCFVFVVFWNYAAC